MKTKLKHTPAVHSSALFGEPELTKLAASWLETHLQVTPDDSNVNWEDEIGAARVMMRRALKRAGMYRPPNK